MDVLGFDALHFSFFLLESWALGGLAGGFG